MDQSLLLNDIISGNSNICLQGDNMATSKLWTSGNVDATLDHSSGLLDISVVVINNPNLNSAAEKSMSSVCDGIEPDIEIDKDPFSEDESNKNDNEGYQTYTIKKNSKRLFDATSPDETIVPIAKRLDSSSFVNEVFIKGVKENLLNKNPIKLKQALTNIDGSFKGDQIKYSKDNLKIHCKSQEQKNRLLNVKILLGIEVIASEHNAISRASSNLDEYERVIIFGVSTDIEENDICEETKAISAKRLLSKKAPNLDRVPSETVVLSYYADPPKSVSIGFKEFKTKLFVPQPIRCWNCQHYGHSEKVCRGKLTCPRCAQNHKFEDCKIPAVISNDPSIPSANSGLRCVNCQQAHSAAYRGCPMFLKQKDILEIKYTNKITYAQAAIQLKDKNAISCQESTVHKTIVNSEAYRDTAILNNPHSSVRPEITNLHFDNAVNHLLPNSSEMSYKSNSSSVPNSALPALNLLHFPNLLASSTSTPSKSDDPSVSASLHTSYMQASKAHQIHPNANSSSPLGMDYSALDLFLTKLFHLISDFFVNFLPLDLIANRFKSFGLHLEEVTKPPV